MKIKWKHNYNIGKFKIKNNEVMRMLKMGARFELTPAYRVYYDKEGKQKKVEMMYVSLKLINDMS